MNFVSQRPLNNFTFFSSAVTFFCPSSETGTSDSRKRTKGRLQLDLRLTQGYPFRVRYRTVETIFVIDKVRTLYI